MSDIDELSGKLDRLIDLQLMNAKSPEPPEALIAATSASWGDHAMKIAMGLVSVGMVWIISTVSNLDTLTQLQGQTIKEMNSKMDGLKEQTQDRFTRNDWVLESAKYREDVNDLVKIVSDLEEEIEQLEDKVSGIPQ